MPSFTCAVPVNNVVSRPTRVVSARRARAATSSCSINAARSISVGDGKNPFEWRTRFTRDVANIVMDLNGVENIQVNALGGADTITIDDLSKTGATKATAATPAPKATAKTPARKPAARKPAARKTAG